MAEHDAIVAEVERLRAQVAQLRRVLASNAKVLRDASECDEARDCDACDAVRRVMGYLVSEREAPEGA